MSEYTAQVVWQRGPNEPFIDNKFSRGHQWEFDGGTTVPASPSPHVVPLPYSIEANVDPEEAFVASLSSCHMLFFLSIAAKKKITVDSYTDNAVGFMEKNANGKIAMTKVILRPLVTFPAELADDKAPSRAELEKIHHLAHEECFIANSVLTEVITEIP